MKNFTQTQSGLKQNNSNAYNIVKAYRHNTSNNILFVYPELWHTQETINGTEKFYLALTMDYKKEQTNTINLRRNYTLIDTPTGDIKRKLEFLAI